MFVHSYFALLSCQLFPREETALADRCHPPRVDTVVVPHCFIQRARSLSDLSIPSLVACNTHHSRVDQSNQAPCGAEGVVPAIWMKWHNDSIDVRRGGASIHERIELA